MAFSYSFHLSAKGHSVNTKGKVSQVSRHNLREYKSEDYDRSQVEILRGGQSILHDMAELYHREFDDVLERYNNKQKRVERKIDDYFDHVSKSRGDVAAEIIIQIGDRDFWENKSMPDKKKMVYIFKDQLRRMEQLCPEFKIVSAVVHYDESSPHMHIVGVPVATGYKKGMEKQVAKTKVFTKESLAMLQDKMRGYAEKGIELSQRHNPELFKNVQLKEKEKGRNRDIPKSRLKEYYELETKIELFGQQAETAHHEAIEVGQVLDSMRHKIKQEEKRLQNLEMKNKDTLQESVEAKQSIERLQGEVKSMQDEKNALLGDIRLLRAENAELKAANEELCSRVEHKINNFEQEAKFEVVYDEKAWDALAKEGKLVARYPSGTVKKIEVDTSGHIDIRWKNTVRVGRCEVGVIQKERFISVPETLLRELIQARDKTVSISERLKSFIDKFNLPELAKKVIEKYQGRSR